MLKTHKETERSKKSSWGDEKKSLSDSARSQISFIYDLHEELGFLIRPNLNFIHLPPALACTRQRRFESSISSAGDQDSTHILQNAFSSSLTLAPKHFNLISISSLIRATFRAPCCKPSPNKDGRPMDGSCGLKLIIGHTS